MHLVLADAANGFGLWLFLGFLYFLPSLIAFHRRVSSVGSVVIINAFLGWTFIGWVAALAMAARTAPASPDAPPTPEA